MEKRSGLSLSAVAVVILAFIGLLLAGCRTPGAGTATSGPAGGAEEGSPAVEAGPRTASLVSVEGAVEIQPAGETEFSAASAGTPLNPGDSIRTGADGTATIDLDGTTTVVVSENSTFTLDTLEGDTASPITRLLLNIGQIFTFHEGQLPQDATFEVETPAGVAAIRGALMAAVYIPDLGVFQTMCLVGRCSAESGGETVEMPGGTWLTGGEDGLGDPEPMTPDQLISWDQIIARLEEQGVIVLDVIVEEDQCACQGPNLVCAGSPTIVDFPACISCECQGADYVCANGQTFAGQCAQDTCGDGVCGPGEDRRV